MSVQVMYFYDGFGRLFEQTDEFGHATRWVYDEHGLPIRRESPNGHIVEWEYDHARGGLLTRQTARLNADDPAPHVTNYAYEPQGRRIETVSNGAPARSVFSGRDILSEYGADWNAAQAHYAYAGLDRPLLSPRSSD